MSQMNRIENTGETAKTHHVCPWQRVVRLDNIFRQFVHNPRRMFGPYVKPGMRVLDFGCGAGFTSIGLARLVGESGEVVAADLQPELLEIVGKRAASEGLGERIHTHQCKPDSIGVDGEFDFASAIFVVHEVPDIDALMREVYSHLKPGGRFLIAEPSFHPVKRDEFEKEIVAAKAAGFKEESRPRIPFSYAVVLIKK